MICPLEAKFISQAPFDQAQFRPSRQCSSVGRSTCGFAVSAIKPLEAERLERDLT